MQAMHFHHLRKYNGVSVIPTVSLDRQTLVNEYYSETGSLGDVQLCILKLDP